MTITLWSLRSAHPELFAQQTWFAGEAFVQRPLGSPLERLPDNVIERGQFPSADCPSAVELAELFVRTPTAPIWNGFLWCSDADQWGQRVFVGGLGTQRGFAGNGVFQIHRFVNFTDEWGVPVWA